MKTFSKKKLAIALALGIGLGMSGTASAGVLATAILEIDNFVLSAGGVALTNIPANNPYVVIQSGNNFGQNTADLFSVPGLASNNASPAILGPQGGQFNLLSVCQGDCPTVLAEGDFSTIPSPPSANFARSDNLLTGAIVSLDTDTPPDGIANVTAGANSATRSDISLDNLATTGIANSLTGTNTTFLFEVIGGPLDVTFSLEYFVKAFAYVEPGSEATSTATAGTGWNLNLSTLAGDIVTSWTPTELNLSASRSDAAPGTQQNPTAGAETGSLSRIVSLADNTQYQLSITHTTQANASLAAAAVPEPGSMGLLAIGLLGLGGLKLRQRKLSA